MERENSIILPIKKGFTQYPISELLYCKADGNYSIFHFSDGKKITVTKCLKEVEAHLSGTTFFRIHKHHIINILQFKEICIAKCKYVVMLNGDKLEISRRKQKNFILFISKVQLTVNHEIQPLISRFKP